MKYPLRKLVTLRPEDLPTFETAPDEWADNYVSNFFAWVSLSFLGPWCSTPEHWTTRLANYLFTSCPCCLLFRGAVLGMILGAAFASVLALAVHFLT